MDKAPAFLISSVLGAGSAQLGVLRTQAALLAHDTLAESAAAFAVEIAALAGGSRCAVALRGGDDDLQLVAASTAVELDPRHAAAATLLAAMHEACDQSRSCAWPPVSDSGDPILQAQRQLAAAGSACTVPLVDRQRIVGAMAVQRDGQVAFTRDELAVLEDIASFAGPVLQIKRRELLPWQKKLREAAMKHFEAARDKRGMWIAIGVVALALIVPVPWRVSAPARLEGAVQRAVVAASDGYLQQANVRPGDRVKEGQVLAELASQELELEKRRRESELSQHETAYRAAQARYDRTQMVSSQSRAAEAQAMLSLAQAQLERTKVVAPFDGIVIKGDLSQTVGAPVQRGETLMVLAPDDRFRLVVEIDEADIAAVQVGQRGQLALSSQPDATLAFTVARIVPVATTGEGRNYFEVEGTLDEASSTLRPGLSGVAKIRAGYLPLIAQFTYRARAWLRMALWTILP
ncbi:HlyD family efflux transporter periplasmic adaptor subunit [Caenimonas koreensis]|uniref:HlyD family efflux transporter periplasmic adaptor subunit n=1 Tax=Caenimonas koreensis TaxID=367474 RepID=UPI003784D103